MDTLEFAKPIYGVDLIAALKEEFTKDCVVFCAPEAWELVKKDFPHKPKEVAEPKSMEKADIDKQVIEMPEAQVVFGIGGGSAIDAAKMYAYKSGARLVLVPTIMSVDAAYTKEVGVRVDNRVRYVGSVIPEKLLIDFELLQQAPPRLNKAGIGDILSIYTALFDWKLAADTKGEKYEEEAVDRANRLLGLLVGSAQEIHELSENGLRLLSELYFEEVTLCDELGSCRPEEGSEHYFAYCLESITKRSFIHGELIAMSVVLTTIYQCRPVKNILAFLDTVGVEYRPSKIGITYDEIKQALLALPQYLKEEKHLLYGIYHHQGMDEARADELIKYFRSEIGD